MINGIESMECVECVEYLTSLLTDTLYTWVDNTLEVLVMLGSFSSDTVLQTLFCRVNYSCSSTRVIMTIKTI